MAEIDGVSDARDSDKDYNEDALEDPLFGQIVIKKGRVSPVRVRVGVNLINRLWQSNHIVVEAEAYFIGVFLRKLRCTNSASRSCRSLQHPTRRSGLCS